jgi:chemotaxis signal transduction protein
MSSAPELKNLIRHIDSQPVEVIDEEVMTARQPAAAREEMNRYVVVEIGALHLAIAIDDLAEVGPLPTITALPNLPAWILGIVNIRSEIVSIVDFVGFLGMSGRAICNGNRFAILRHKKQKIGLRLDRIIGTVNKAVSEKQLLEPVDRNSLHAGLVTSGLLVGKKLYYILSVKRFLSASRLVDYNNTGK